jgi:hypothetical protein
MDMHNNKYVYLKIKRSTIWNTEAYFDIKVMTNELEI